MAGSRAAHLGLRQEFDEDKCAAGRKVIVFRVKQGDAEKVGTDIAQANGDKYQWSAGNPGNGKYFAKVMETSKCEGDVSKTPNSWDCSIVLDTLGCPSARERLRPEHAYRVALCEYPIWLTRTERVRTRGGDRASGPEALYVLESAHPALTWLGSPMLASILPGLREIRTPLAAGYVWLVFLFLVAGSPKDASDFSGPIADLTGAAESLSSAAVVVAVSFVAYLIGSLSVDLFGVILPRGLAAISASGVLMFASDDVAEEASFFLSEIVRGSERLRDLMAMRGTKEEGSGEESEHIRAEMLAAISRYEDLQSELKSAGKSEEEQPEARRPMLEAEEDLRTAVVPPLVAVSIYLSFDSIWWLFGVLFASALYLQAAVRHTEAASLRIGHRRGMFLGEVETAMRRARNALTQNDDVGAYEAVGKVDWRQLRAALRSPVHFR